ncbi:hypothetical protein KFK09_015756 [Dendrobium nobile]|uniref:Uncharacterized protein n=1 Tax=Dendrobium nobile TaxID=94219 RepID=A0A8T3B876_DENNO|nr:hypothetical protein KFK09_015756 [Dendrobium nobile]
MKLKNIPVETEMGIALFTHIQIPEVLPFGWSLRATPFMHLEFGWRRPNLVRYFNFRLTTENHGTFELGPLELVG